MKNGCQEEAWIILFLHEKNLVVILTLWFIKACNVIWLLRQDLDAEFRQASRILHDKNSPLRLARLDVGKNRAVKKQFAINEYPTVKFFRRDLQPLAYTWHRVAEDIVRWMEKKMGPPCVEVCQCMFREGVVSLGCKYQKHEVFIVTLQFQELFIWLYFLRKRWVYGILCSYFWYFFIAIF